MNAMASLILSRLARIFAKGSKNGGRPVHGLRIRDLENGVLTFDLHDLLALLGDRAARSDWLCLVEQCIATESGRPNLEEAYSAAALMTGAELLELASETRQVIDGVFKGFRPGENMPWIAFEAVDSTCWEVYAADAADLTPFATTFRHIEEIVSRRRPSIGRH